MDVRMQKHRITCWLGRLFVVLSLMSSWGAQAAIESVAPLSGGTLWYFSGTGPGGLPTAAAVCQQQPAFGNFSFVGTVPNCCGYAAAGYRDCMFKNNSTGQTTLSGTAIPVSNAVCPVPTVNPAVPYKYNPVTGMCERTAQETCPVAPLTQPPFSDACSTSLEAGKGADINNKCGTLRKPDMVDAAACIATKINKLSSPPVNPKYTSPSATIRTTEYQNHLLEIWDKSATLNCLMNSLAYTPEYLAAMKVACAQRKAEIDAEKQSHGIKHQPSSSGDAAPHVEHRAIDVPGAVVESLIKQVTLYTTTYPIINGKKTPVRTITSDVEDYIHSATVNPPACDSRISWGGRFKNYDPVHFQLP
jgi:hypothetical protein